MPPRTGPVADCADPVGRGRHVVQLVVVEVRVDARRGGDRLVTHRLVNPPKVSTRSAGQAGKGASQVGRRDVEAELLDRGIEP